MTHASQAPPAEGILLDLTRPLDRDHVPFSDGAYSDPPLTISPWCQIRDQGFCVAQLNLGTQTGTHVDAPAHFFEHGATLDRLRSDAWVAPYLYLAENHLRNSQSLERRLRSGGSAGILFFAAWNRPVLLSDEVGERLLMHPAPIWVMAGSLLRPCPDPYAFHRWVANHGKFLVEDLDLDACRNVPSNGSMVVAPLRLAGVSGSPCRVFAWS